MNKIFVVSLSAVMVFGFSAAVFAQQKPKLNAKQVAAAAQIFKNNPTLFKDPERLKQLMRLAESMRKAKQ